MPMETVTPKDDHTPMVRKRSRHKGCVGEVYPFTSAQDSSVRKYKPQEAAHECKR